MMYSVSSPRRVGLFFVFLVLAVAWDAGVLLAHEDDCTVLDINGLERDCTATEELGKCLVEAEDSFDQCILATSDDGELSFQDWAACDTALAFDGAACAASMPFDILFD